MLSGSLLLAAHPMLLGRRVSVCYDRLLLNRQWEQGKSHNRRCHSARQLAQLASAEPGRRFLIGNWPVRMNKNPSDYKDYGHYRKLIYLTGLRVTGTA